MVDAVQGKLAHGKDCGPRTVQRNMSALRDARMIAAKAGRRVSHYIGKRDVLFADRTCVLCEAEHLSDCHGADGDWPVVVELAASLRLSNPDSKGRP